MVWMPPKEDPITASRCEIHEREALQVAKRGQLVPELHLVQLDEHAAALRRRSRRLQLVHDVGARRPPLATPVGHEEDVAARHEQRGNRINGSWFLFASVIPEDRRKRTSSRRLPNEALEFEFTTRERDEFRFGHRVLRRGGRGSCECRKQWPCKGREPRHKPHTLSHAGVLPPESADRPASRPLLMAERTAAGITRSGDAAGFHCWWGATAAACA